MPRVPEDKCHMVLPEIEEEVEEEPGLSLTSLMLGQSSANMCCGTSAHLHLILHRVIQPDGQHWAGRPPSSR